jgi:Tol biopolymer transport system component
MPPISAGLSGRRWQWPRRFELTCLCCVSLAPVSCARSTMSARTSGEGTKIAFDRHASNAYSGTTDIYVVNADGSGLQRLTKAQPGSPTFSYLGSGASRPAWSPDGKKIAFLVDRIDHSSIYLINADGRGLRQLTKMPAADVPPSPPAWSPDGKKIAFSGPSDVVSDNIYVMNADGCNPRQLTRDPGPGGADNPSWSPDGTKIVFNSDKSGTGNIYVMNADGSGRRRLTREPHSSLGLGAVEPAWSPDGRKIAFAAESGRLIAIFVVNADGSAVRRLTGTASLLAASPAWSPDGTKIAFEGAPIGKKTTAGKVNPSIYVMNADGSGVRLLIRSGAHPAWRPSSG